MNFLFLFQSRRFRFLLALTAVALVSLLHVIVMEQSPLLKSLLATTSKADSYSYSSFHQQTQPTTMNQQQSLFVDRSKNDITTTITKNTNTTTANTISATGGLYLCGYSYQELAYSLFPDYAEHFVTRYDSPKTTTSSQQQQHETPTEDDIMVFGVHGSCQTSLHRFPGKILFVNGESRGDTRQMYPYLRDRSWQIGNAPDAPQDDNHSVLVYHAANSLFKTPQEYWPRLLDPAQKAHSRQTYQAVAYVSRNCVDYREDAAELIATNIVPVHHGNKCNGRGKAVPMPYVPDTNHWTSIFDIYQEYSFCMVLENANKPWYITEKIMTAFIAGCIPIYYGTNEIFDVFNKDAFIFWDIHNTQPAEEQLKELVQNPKAYERMQQQQPILANGEQTLRDYFSLSDQIGNGELKAKIRNMMGLPSR